MTLLIVCDDADRVATPSVVGIAAIAGDFDFNRHGRLHPHLRLGCGGGCDWSEVFDGDDAAKEQHDWHPP